MSRLVDDLRAEGRKASTRAYAHKEAGDQARAALAGRTAFALKLAADSIAQEERARS